MGRTNIGEHTTVRKSYFSKSSYFSPAIHPKLQHCILMLWHKLKKCERNTNMIVQIAFIFQDLMVLRNDTVCHFLSRSFSITSRNSYNRYVSLLSHIMGCILKRFECIFNINDSAVMGTGKASTTCDNAGSSFECFMAE